ncbi:Metallo-hydrolase/oxidoreductase [Hypoxylon trugodes]|uniref:Metallo-hydrolase/oxidoreductase n=1 Tax=Hypoxylon trugodes TaxID=326681 RepID=UPI00219E6732|nr:Metallo-hydrolase/oxidoreductase [Hypoxylon trugodes]KAI1387852.1 Metallo-hydrolase/oxidoreductase [Hypoxylon trugodes]
MSTFNGIIHEFPDIRIDYFRGFNDRPPLACFLSHVHSDHLTGLEVLRSPFVYCSAATREILLRLEKYPCRMNLAKGILENPRVQTYKHLTKVLKPIPLDTPTELELEPGKIIRVTLLDANHCVGAVMFLIEGDGTAILYTGDIRSEPWWVNSIVRNPTMIEYTTGMQRLNRIYLDTSMLGGFPLQTKAEGLRLLLEQVWYYPEDTIFYIQAWTYGYEDVWIALSKALNSKIHVDKYKMGVYKSLATKSTDNRFAAQTHLAKEAPYLAGFTCGNNQHEGCLTLDENVRIHSCEKGTGCAVIKNKPVVWIKPIVAHLRDGQDVDEVGIGGGGEDLIQRLSIGIEDIRALTETVNSNLQLPDGSHLSDGHLLSKALLGSRDLGLDMEINDSAEESIQIYQIFRSIFKKVKTMQNPVTTNENFDTDALPNRIVFPYARHSSIPELRHLIEAFRPIDIWPCTVDPEDWMESGITMEELFGDLCGGLNQHDKILAAEYEAKEGRKKGEGYDLGTPPILSSQPEPPSSPTIPSTIPSTSAPKLQGLNSEESPIVEQITPEAPEQYCDLQSAREEDEAIFQPQFQQNKGNYQEFQENQSIGSESEENSGDNFGLNLQGSQASTISAYEYETRLHAFRAAQANMEGDGDWAAINLISTADNHTSIEPDLGNS